MNFLSLNKLNDFSFSNPIYYFFKPPSPYYFKGSPLDGPQIFNFIREPYLLSYSSLFWSSKLIANMMLYFRLSFILSMLNSLVASSSNFFSPPLLGVRCATTASIAHNHIKIFIVSLETGFMFSPG